MANLLLAADESYERFLLRGRSRYQRVSLGVEFEGTTAECGFISQVSVPGTQWRTVTVEPIKMTLCPNCTLCPEVVITDEGVTIGEDTNTVRLSCAEWNELVRLIKQGELHEI
jgi:hypothetical protein